MLAATEMQGGACESIAGSLRMSAVPVWHDRNVHTDMIIRVKRTAANIDLSAGATADLRHAMPVLRRLGNEG